MSGIAPKRNAFIFKIAPQANIHRKNDIFFCRKMGPLANGVLCLSTPKHNSKSGTVDDGPRSLY